jgi:YHS domain-containing protein
MLAIVILFFSACQIASTKTEKKAETEMAQDSSTNTMNAFEHMLVDNKKDPSCGMPVTAGISDTSHYKNKVLGFCSKECKDEFLKNPDANIAAADLKK